MAPQLHEYVIFIDSQHLVDVCDVQLLHDTIQQISDDVGDVGDVQNILFLWKLCALYFTTFSFFSDANIKTLTISQYPSVIIFLNNY